MVTFPEVIVARHHLRGKNLKKPILAVLPFFLFLILFSINTTANLILTPSSFPNITVTANQPFNITLNIVNNQSFLVYNVTIEQQQFIKSNVIPQINPNENSNLNIEILANIQGNLSINAKLKYLFITTTTATPQTHNILIQNNAYVPNIITIRKLDTVKFQNLDSVSHSTTSVLFDQNLAQNEEFSYQFQNEGIVNYYDSGIGFSGIIALVHYYLYYKG
ncbi:MAG: hypothetical protein AABY22_00875, partial [Nanoarchaeota archaeon]